MREHRIKALELSLVAFQDWNSFGKVVKKLLGIPSIAIEAILLLAFYEHISWETTVQVLGVPAPREGDLDGAVGSWLQPGPELSVVSIGGEDGKYLSLFHSNKFNK